MMNVLLFGRLAEICGSNNYTFDLKDTDSVCDKLSEDFPEIKRLSFAVAVNQKLVVQNTELNDGDEVALMPPYSGG
ncbi:MAG: MoaD/ThiS family protein [Bacteroidetes bacterium]|nr:MoaD/ThiS family protein [Bacteroidota bacterium]